MGQVPVILVRMDHVVFLVLHERCTSDCSNAISKLKIKQAPIAILLACRGRVCLPLVQKPAKDPHIEANLYCIQLVQHVNNLFCYILQRMLQRRTPRPPPLGRGGVCNMRMHSHRAETSVRTISRGGLMTPYCYTPAASHLFIWSSSLSPAP